MLLYINGAVALIFTMTIQLERYEEINRYLRLKAIKVTEESTFTKNAFKKNISTLLSTNDGRHTCEIKSRIVMAKAAFNKKRALFTSTLELKLRKKLVKCYIWSIALYGAEIWTIRAADQKYL